MNGDAHNIIFQSAVSVLPEDMQKIFNSHPDLLAVVGNYPDLFDDPSKPEEDKIKIDPQWQKYCVYPNELAGSSLHSWPHAIPDQHERKPLTQYLLQQMIDCCEDENFGDFIKFSGCISHLFGDTTQPAHLGIDTSLSFVRQLIPPPNERFKNFHYHTDVEKVTGECGELHTPQLLGLSSVETSWRLAGRCTNAVVRCRRFIVPIIQALFARDEAKAIKNASEPVTIAAQLTADAIYTAIKIATNSFTRTEREKLELIDLRFLPADEAFHDLVYGGALLDGNKDVPPNNKPIVPAKLKFADGVRQVKGLGVLPHSGMSRERDCYMTWNVPAGTFKQFSAGVGLHADLAIGGAVSFHVLLDGKEVWTSGRMTKDDCAQEISIELGNAETLTLKVCDANNEKSFWKNHAIWMNPVISK